MKNTLVLSVVATFVLLVGGCERTREDVANDMVSKLEEMAKVAEGVKDESSAKSAATKLQSLNADLKKLTDEGAKMPEPSESDKKEVEAQQKKAFDALGRLIAAMEKMDPKLQKMIEPAMGNFGSGGGAGGMFK